MPCGDIYHGESPRLLEITGKANEGKQVHRVFGVLLSISTVSIDQDFSQAPEPCLIILNLGFYARLG